MVSLIALISSGKGTWGQVLELVRLGKWDRVFLICSDFAFDKFEIDPTKAVKLRFDERRPEEEVARLAKFFRGEVSDFEVALNLTSGSGFEHMAVLSSVLRAGLGVRFVYPERGEVCEFEILSRFEGGDF